MQMQRSSLRITLAVWRALFLREAIARLFSARAAWVWVFAEPLLHAAILMVVFTLIRVRTIGGIDTALWILVGLLAFFMFRRPVPEMVNAINANRSLFAYRQVRPVDTVLMRGVLEGFLVVLAAAILLGGAGITGHFTIPGDPLMVLGAFAGMWLLGIGLGLVLSVAAVLVSELAELLRLAMMPLSLVSGVMFPLAAVNEPMRAWLMLNPLAHGIEAARLGFAPHYHAAPELRLSYLFLWGLITLFMGLTLQRRFAMNLAAQ